jgi:hypothetical protein
LVRLISPGEGESMSALRKSNYAPELNAGHRMTWVQTVLTNPDLPLSTDARLLLCVLLTHHGDNGVKVGIRRLSGMCNMSFGRCAAARDELVTYSIIRCDIGAGTRATSFELVALEAWFREWVAARSVPVSSPSVPESPPSVHTVGTKPLEPQESEKAGKPDLKVVGIEPTKGWPALVHQAPDHQRKMWLDKLTEDGRDADGTIRLTAPNTLFQSTVTKMLTEDPAIAALCAKLGIDPEKVNIRAAKPPGADLPPVRGAREGDSDGYDQKRSMGRQLRENIDRIIPDKLEAASDQPVIPLVQRPPSNNVTDLSAYRTKRQDDDR